MFWKKSFLSFTVVRKKCCFWKSNRGGQSSLSKNTLPFLLKVDFKSCLVSYAYTNLWKSKCLKGHLKMWETCFSNVVFVAESASSSVYFIDIEGKVTIKPESLKFYTELLSQQTRFSLSPNGTVPVLRKLPTMHLQTLAAEIRNSKCVQIHPPLQKPTSICASEDILSCADNTQTGVL